jgi:hypothetical protein
MALSNLKNVLFSNIKNLYGWKTDRKIVVISVDDYGNVRLDSKEARERMENEGLEVLTPFKGFDLFDSLENRFDLEMLFEVLTSVRDRNGYNAILTPFAVPCNINFEKIKDSDFSEYYYETLTETYSKLSTLQSKKYQGAWDLWEEGIDKHILKPQFHGREHINLKLFKEKLEKKDDKLIIALKNRSYARISANEYRNISSTGAFEFDDFEENAQFTHIIDDGLKVFNNVFGYRATHFNSPGGREHTVIHDSLKKNGIKYIDTPFIKSEHQGAGKYQKKFNYTGKINHLGQLYLVRNVVFEPTRHKKFDSVDYALMQIEAAFRWNRPAIISSHRVNFCGHIDETNRKIGLDALRDLLQCIVKRWPDVEFMAANELGDLIAGETK